MNKDFLKASVRMQELSPQNLIVGPPLNITDSTDYWDRVIQKKCPIYRVFLKKVLHKREGKMQEKIKMT